MSNLIDQNTIECELNSENYLSYMKQREFTVILFYAPYNKQYRKLGFKLTELKLSKNVAFCKINIHENKLFKEEYQLDSNPSFFIFYRSKKYRIQYKGLYSLDKINTWIKENTENYIERLTKYEEIVNLATKENNLTVVFFGEIGHYDREWRIFKAVGRKFNRNEIKFYYCERCKEFNIFDLVVFNNYDKVKSLYKNSLYKKNITYDNFYRFIDINTKPLVRNVTYDFTDDIFKYKNPGMILYYDSDQIKLFEDSDLFLLLRKIAYKYKGKLFIGVGHLKQAIVINMAIDLGILRNINSQNITLFIHDSRDLIVRSYYFNTSNYTFENLDNFVEHWENNTNSYRLYRSQDIPENPKRGNSHILVGNNFKQFIQNSDKVSIVMFYDPFCSSCREIHNNYEVLSEKFGKIFNFILIDGKKNEIDTIKIRKIPSIFIWKNNKSRPIYYKRQLDIQNFTNYLEKKFKNFIIKEEL